MPEIVPPLPIEELERDLINTDFAAYVYIGTEADKGWKYARTAFKLIPRLRVYLVKDITLLKPWTGNKRPSAIAFKWDDTVHAFLTKSQAEDLQFVLDTIAEAMQP
jgi:hypothetical protein